MRAVLRAAAFLACLAHAVADHYRTLSVPRDASADAIKSSFRATALKHHPDRLPRTADAATRRQSQRTFERANEAFEVLSDPAQRRQYDFDLAHPIQEGADGIYRQGQGEAAGMAPQRPTVEVQVRCTLEQLSGFHETRVPLNAWSVALGASVDTEIATRLGLPLRLHLPPGSRNGDVVSRLLRIGPRGLEVRFTLVGEERAASWPWRRRWQRRSDDLLTTITLPTWHRLLGAQAVRVRGIDGASVLVWARGATVRSGEVVRVAGAGMTVAGSSDSATSSARGDLVATLEVRPIGAELLRAAAAVGTGAGLWASGALAQRGVRLAGAYAAARVADVQAVLALARELIETHALGRARPQAKRERERARMERELMGLSAKRERKAQQGRKERTRRRAAHKAKLDGLWQPIWQPLSRRAKAAWAWAWE